MRKPARSAADVLHAIGTAGPDPDAFARLGVTELPRLVPSELTTLSVCDLRSGHRHVVGNPGSRLSAQDIAAFDRHFFDHPLVRYHSENHGAGARRLSDGARGRAFRATELYNDYYRRIGIDHAVAVPLAVDDETLVSFVFNRAGRDFTDAEIVLFDRLRGWLAAMYRSALAVRRAGEAMAQLREIAEGEDWAVIRVDAKQQVRELPMAAAAMLRNACPDARPRAGAALPAPIDAWLRRAARADAPRLAFAPLVLRGERVSVTVRALPELAGDAAWILLVRSEARTPEGAVPAPANSELTARERDVLRWVAAGKTDRQIAATLGASHRTVQKHLEHIYVKLGVENRTAAAMRFR